MLPFTVANDVHEYLFQARELEVAIFWRDWRSMSALKFIRLEDFLDNKRHGMAVHLEPKGILFIEVCYFIITLVYNTTLHVCMNFCRNICRDRQVGHQVGV